MFPFYLIIFIFSVILILVYFLLKKLVEPEKDNTGNTGQTSSNAQENQILIDRNISIDRTVERDNSMRNQSNQQTIQSLAGQSEPKPITKKDQLKMLKKKEKEEAREYQKMLLEEKKLREQEKERIYLEKEMKREEERKIEEETLRKLKEEQEKKENDIFNQWKDKFVVQEEGEEIGDINDENLINKFIEYIKLRKVVSLEDLSSVFKVHPNELVERLNCLEAQGKIIGIIDDRGKYIYLTDKELQAIEKIFMQRGRISKVELIKECNKIIRFLPTEEDKLKIIEEQNMQWKTFENEIKC